MENKPTDDEIVDAALARCQQKEDNAPTVKPNDGALNRGLAKGVISEIFIANSEDHSRLI